MLDHKFVFVADYFADKLIGGAELSTQALIETCPGEVIKIESGELSRDDIEAHMDAYWIFTNIWQMKYGLIPFIIRNIKNYSFIEYDFKYCVYRSPDMHLVAEGMPCNCINPLMDDFFYNSKHMFFMSEMQRAWYHHKAICPIPKTYVLSSLFSEETLQKLNELYKTRKPIPGWAIIWSSSALKGFNEAVSYCDQNKIDYYILKDLNYEELLRTLVNYEGLIYKPQGGDTCPRAVIEAKLLGLNLDLNYFVMHKDEDWFSGDRERCLNYLKSNKQFFWERILSK